VQVSEFKVQSVGFEDLGYQFGGVSGWGSLLRFWGLGFRVQGSGFRVQGSGFRVYGAGFGH
jgi:hypothetical protein